MMCFSCCESESTSAGGDSINFNSLTTSSALKSWNEFLEFVGNNRNSHVRLSFDDGGGRMLSCFIRVPGSKLHIGNWKSNNSFWKPLSLVVESESNQEQSLSFKSLISVYKEVVVEQDWIVVSDIEARFTAIENEKNVLASTWWFIRAKSKAYYHEGSDCQCIKSFETKYTIKMSIVIARDNITMFPCYMALVC
ncbi:hypothetical protein ACFE04_021699 [Oxalis oulophora]